jgi:hypothetical protein
MPTVLRSGEITEDGVLGLLREIEGLCTTGVLTFEAGDLVGKITLVAGRLAVEQEELPEGEDPVEVFLQLREGSYRVEARLPDLAVSKGDDARRAGSLDVHLPSDLMDYCERAGLTGILRLTNGQDRAEAIYDRGVLVGIRLDGRVEEDLPQVFAWQSGAFEIEAHQTIPQFHELGTAGEDPADRDPTIPRISHEENILRVVEMSLASIVQAGERPRAISRQTPSSLPEVRGRFGPETSSDRAERKVRVVVLRPADSSSVAHGQFKQRIDEDVTTRMLAKDAMADVGPTALPLERGSGPGPAQSDGDADRRKRRPAGAMLGLVVLLIALLLGLGLFLAQENP